MKIREAVKILTPMFEDLGHVEVVTEHGSEIDTDKLARDYTLAARLADHFKRVVDSLRDPLLEAAQKEGGGFLQSLSAPERTTKGVVRTGTRAGDGYSMKISASLPFLPDEKDLIQILKDAGIAESEFLTYISTPVLDYGKLENLKMAGVLAPIADKLEKARTEKFTISTELDAASTKILADSLPPTAKKPRSTKK